MPFDTMTPAPQQQQTEHPVFSLEGLAAWLRLQPDIAYDYWCDRCLLGSYFAVRWGRYVTMGSRFVTTHGPDARAYELPPRWNDIAVTEPHRYGAALVRTEAEIARQERGR